MFMVPHPSQQHAGLNYAVLQLQQEVTRPKARFKPTSPKKSGVDGGANQVPTYLGQSLHLYSPWWSSLAIITSSHCISGVCPMMQHPVQPYKGLSPVQQWQKPEYPVEKPLQRNPLRIAQVIWIWLQSLRWCFIGKIDLWIPHPVGSQSQIKFFWQKMSKKRCSKK